MPHFPGKGYEPVDLGPLFPEFGKVTENPCALPLLAGAEADSKDPCTVAGAVVVSFESALATEVELGLTAKGK